MSASNALENSLLLLIFNATTWNNIAENDTTGPLTDLHVALHTGDPGEAGDQETSEATYTSYARIAVARTSGGWTVAAANASNAAAVTFPQATGGSETITHFSVGEDISGAGVLLFSGTVTPNLAVSNGVQPEFPIGDLDVNAD